MGCPSLPLYLLFHSSLTSFILAAETLPLVLYVTNGASTAINSICGMV